MAYKPGEARLSESKVTQVFKHISVLLEESLSGLALKSNGTYIDGTFGRGGHSRAILSELGPEGRLFSIDRDPQAVAEARTIRDPRFTIIQGVLSDIESHSRRYSLVNKVDGVILDLGVSSPQLDDAARGFSFMRDGPLDMRMDPTSGIPVSKWLSEESLSNIAWVIRRFGEEKYSKLIAKEIVSYRNTQGNSPLNSTIQLADLIARVVPRRYKEKKHPATRTFQAFRIYINNEMEEINVALKGALNVLAPGGRLSVISFHSLEDRIVKQFIRQESRGAVVPCGVPLTSKQIDALFCAKLKSTGKAKRPLEEEVKANPRSRSSTLRVAQKL